METQGCSEVRRLHIIYFLSRKGRTEHPHLVRVHHHSRSGVRLRDVKRWLGDLRGKDMPESFSWSYKRRYKTGYVWQDLMDDDLINPISDNEYVLKGSDILPTNIKVSKQNGQFLQEETNATSKEDQSHNSSEASVYISTKSSIEIEEESPIFGSETSTLTDDSIKKPEKKTKQGKHSSTFYSTFLSKKMSDKSTTTDENKSHRPSAAAAAADADHSKSTSNVPTKAFRNLITCGASDTNDSAVVPINKQSSSNMNNRPNFMNMCSSELKSVVQQSAEICKRENDRFGGSQRVFGTPSWTQQQYWSCGRKSFDGVKDSLKNKGELRDQRTISAAFMPVNAPNCSQCGKPFKPEKLHAHMKSCKGMKAMSKTTVVADHVDKPLKNLVAH